MEDVCGESGTAAAGPETQLQATEAQQPAAPQTPPVYCQVLGCGVLLTGGKIYCIKKRTCSAHIQAESVMLPGDDRSPFRFCQQCGKFEPLDRFDGTKRSCRARLAKRRSGTRAQLLKKGCGCQGDRPTDQGMDSCNTGNSPDNTAGAAVSQLDSQAAEQELLMMYEQVGDFIAMGLCGDGPAHAAVAVPGSHQPSAPSLSDGAPMAAAAAAASAAAVASAPHHALSAPLFGLGTGAPFEKSMQPADVKQAGRVAADDHMGQAEVLLALQQQADDKSDTLLRFNLSTSSAHAPNAAAALSAAGGSGSALPSSSLHVTFAEPTTCSVPFSKLELGGHSGSFSVQTPGSPLASMDAAPCKSAPLAGGSQKSGGGLLHAVGLPPQRSRSSVTSAAYQQQQEQGVARCGSKLKWLINELQQELEACDHAELDSLNNEELGTLLCAALAPSAVAGGAPTAAGALGAKGLSAAAPAAVQNASTGSLLGLLGPIAAAPASSLSMGMGGQVMSHTSLPADYDLTFHQVQVHQLQQKVQQLQLELQQRRDANVDGSSLAGVPRAATPMAVPAAVSSAAAAAAFDASALFRSISSVLDNQGPPAVAASAAMQQQPGMRRAFGSSGNLTAPLPGVHLSPGGVGGGGAALPNRPQTPVPAVAPASLAQGWPSLASHASGIPLMQQQSLGPQQAFGAMPAVSGQLSANAAAMQFMALQAQLKMAEEEMMDLLRRQATAAR